MGTEQISDKTEKQKRDGYRSFYNRVTKRVLDLVLALAGSVIVTPILLVIGIFIAIEDGFPIFYTPLRGGYHGKRSISSSFARCTRARISSAGRPR